MIQREKPCAKLVKSLRAVGPHRIADIWLYPGTLVNNQKAFQHLTGAGSGETSVTL